MPKSTVSAAKKKVAKAKSAKSRVSKTRSAAKKVRSKVRSAAKPLKASTSDTQESLRQEVPQAVNAADPAIPSAVSSAAIPLGQSIDLEQEAIRNAADNANIFDPAVGYGLALPGETGVAAVDRIKKSKAGRKPDAAPLSAVKSLSVEKQIDQAQGIIRGAEAVSIDGFVQEPKKSRKSKVKKKK